MQIVMASSQHCLDLSLGWRVERLQNCQLQVVACTTENVDHASHAEFARQRPRCFATSIIWPCPSFLHLVPAKLKQKEAHIVVSLPCPMLSAPVCNLPASLAWTVTARLMRSPTCYRHFRGLCRLHVQSLWGVLKQSNAFTAAEQRADMLPSGRQHSTRDMVVRAEQ